MKKTHMKTGIIGTLSTIALGSILLLSACKKNDDNNAGSSNITTDDAADVVAYSVSSSSNGFATELNDIGLYNDNAGVYTTAAKVNCGTTYDTTFTRAYTGANASYNYAVHRTFNFTCLNGTVNTLQTTRAMHGTYDLPRMSSNDSASSSFTIDGLSGSATTVSVNGNYTRNGSQQSKVRNLRSFTSYISITLNNVTLHKSTHQITGGSAAFTVSGAGSGGHSFSYTGTLTFNGNGTATLVVNGNTYTITL